MLDDLARGYRTRSPTARDSIEADLARRRR